MKKCEMETTINIYADERRAHVYSSDPYWIGKIKKLIERCPEECKLERTEGEGYFFSIPVNFIGLRPARKLSDERRAAIKERFFHTWDDAAC